MFLDTTDYFVKHMSLLVGGRVYSCLRVILINFCVNCGSVITFICVVDWLQVLLAHSCVTNLSLRVFPPSRMKLVVGTCMKISTSLLVVPHAWKDCRQPVVIHVRIVFWFYNWRLTDFGIMLKLFLLWEYNTEHCVSYFIFTLLRIIDYNRCYKICII